MVTRKVTTVLGSPMTVVVSQVTNAMRRLNVTLLPVELILNLLLSVTHKYLSCSLTILVHHPWERPHKPHVQLDVVVSSEKVLLFLLLFILYFTFNSMFARLGTDCEIRNQWFFAILEAMTTD